MDGQYLPDDEIDIDSLASSEPPEYVPQMFSEGGEVEPPGTEESTALRNIRQRIVELEKQKLALWAEKNQPEMLTANNNELAGVLIRMRGEDLRDRDNSSRPLNDYYQTLPTEENIFELRRQMPRPESFNYPPLIEEGRDTRELEKKFQDDIFEGERDWEKQLDLPYSGPYHRGGPYSQGGEVKERDIEYYTKGGEASLDSQTEAMNKYLLGEEEDAMPMAYATEPTRPTQTAKAMLKKVTMKSGGGSKRPKEMSLEEGDLSPAIPELGAPQTEQEKLIQIATARSQYDALERAYQLKAQAAQKAGRGLMRPTFNALAFDKPTLEKPGPLMARTFSKGGEADKKDPELTGINRVSDFIAQHLPASVFPTSGRTFLETVQGKRDPITEGNFSPEELAVMKEMIALKGGDAGDIQYGDYHALAKVMRAQGKIPASTTPSLFSMSDSLGNVQTTLGRFKYGRDAEGNLVVRDTYDFNPPQDPNSMQEQRTAEYGAMGPYSLVREYAGEKIPPGRGREININLGKPVKGAEGSPAAKIFQSARDEYNRQEKELLRLDKPTLEKMARPLARTFSKGGEADALEGMQKKARENEMYRASEKYLQSRGQMPDIEVGRFMRDIDNAAFTALNLPMGSGTILVNKDVIASDFKKDIGPALLAHEITHAADRQMEQQAIEQRGKGTKFAEAYEKLMGSEGRNRLEPARRADYEWTEGNRLYRSTPEEIAAHGVGAFSGPVLQDRAPLHVDPTAATEFQILLDLAQRDIDKGPKGLEKVPTFLRKFFKYADGGPVYRAEGSPASGERLTPQQIEQLAADQAALNQYYAAKARPSTGMNRKRGPISQQLDSGEAYANMAKGVTEFPYDLVGAPVDVATMLLRPFGYSTEKPVMGSDWIKAQMTKAGVRPEPPADPTAKGFYTAGELLSNLTNPAGVARKVGPVVEKGVATVGKEAARQVERGIFNEGPLRAITPQPAFAVRPEGGGTTFTGVRESASSRTNAPVSKFDKMIDAGANPRIEGLSNEMGDAIENFWRTKAQNYFTRQYGTPSDPVFKQIMSGQLRTPGLQRSIPDYALDQTRAGKTRVNPVTGESRFYPKYPQALEDMTRRYDEMTGLEGVAFNVKQPLFNPDYPSTLGDQGTRLELAAREGVTDKLIASGLNPNLINPKVTLTGPRGDAPDALLGYVPGEYKELYSMYANPPKDQNMVDRIYSGLGLAKEKPGLPENITRAIETSEPIYDINFSYRSPLKDILTPENINRYLATKSPSEINKMRFEDVVNNSAKYNLDMLNTQNLVEAIRSGKRIPEKTWMQGLSEPLMTFEKEGKTYTWHRILENEATAIEGAYLGHSVGGYAKGGNYGAKEYRLFKEGAKEVYTLRDSRGRPFTTVEVEKTHLGPLDRIMSYDDVQRAKAEGRELGPVKTILRQTKGNGAKTGNVPPKDVDDGVLTFIKDYIKPDKFTEHDQFLTPKLEQYKIELSGRPRP
jgi:hypothetical protein